jgi:hypothetical protein
MKQLQDNEKQLSPSSTLPLTSTIDELPTPTPTSSAESSMTTTTHHTIVYFLVGIVTQICLLCSIATNTNISNLFMHAVRNKSFK